MWSSDSESDAIESSQLLVGSLLAPTLKTRTQNKRDQLQRMKKATHDGRATEIATR